MATYSLPVGSVRIVNGTRIGRTRTMELEGEQLAVRDEQIDVEGLLGFTETLYYTVDRRLLVHIESWSRQHGEQSIYTVLEIDRRDLQPGGRFEVLGQGAWAWLRR